MDALEPGLIAQSESQRVGVIGEGAEGIGQFDLAEGRVLLTRPPIHLGVEEHGFDQPDAVEAPAGGDHLVDQILFDA